jgi:signal transduction histidine kinase
MNPDPTPPGALPAPPNPGRLVDLLAQELKDHLGEMRQSAQMLNARAAALGDPKLERTAAQILLASAQMTAFVSDFLGQASADLLLALKPVPLDLAQVAAEVAQGYLETARRKEISLLFAGGELPVPVAADRNAVEHVLRNLISNALKFSPVGRRVWVGVGIPAEGGGECRVQDEGPGLTPAEQANLFQPHARLGPQPTAGESSTGLGLSIAKKLVDGMHGALRCESIPGTGTTFIVTLPAAAAA